MARSKTQPIPKFSSLDKLIEFFDIHDMGNYWDKMQDVHFNINIQKRTHIFALEEDLAKRVTTIARAKQIPSSTLINRWLREKISEQIKVTA